MNTVKTLAQTPVTQNGAAKKETALATVKSETVTTPKKEEGEKLPSIDDRLHKLNVLFDLQKKHAKLQETKINLTKFEIAQNKENSTLELEDDNGNSFTTTNPVVIAEVVSLVLKVISEKTAEVEAKIIF